MNRRRLERITTLLAFVAVNREFTTSAACRFRRAARGVAGDRFARAGLAVVVACCVLIGCSSTEWVTVRGVPSSPLTERLQLESWSGPQITERTALILRRSGLDPETAPADLLQPMSEVVRREDSGETTYAYAELAFLAGQSARHSNSSQALDYYCLAASEAFRYLFDPRLADQRNPYDPLYRGASDLYNGSVDEVLRLLKRDGRLTPAEIDKQHQNQPWDVTVIARDGPWSADQFDRFELASDFEVAGLTNQYRTYGLGVPLVAVRRTPPETRPTDGFYPPGLAVPLTAFMRPTSWEHWQEGHGGARHSVVLELYNPLNATMVDVGPLRIPLESDLTTPLAWFLNEAELEPFATKGLLRPTQDKSKLFFAQPYEADKIPVVFVHGLWSDPSAWAEMLNELRATPEIRARYQFWFYMYPTGQPFWYSAADLRDKLQEARLDFDPDHRSAAMDQMVLIGHSMGGLVSKMQAVESGNNFWNAISEQPFNQVDPDSEVHVRLAKTFFFHPNPSIREVITIGSPHRGSSYANATTKWLASKVVRLPTDLVSSLQNLAGMKPGIFRAGFSPEYDTSISSLSADSPILPVLLDAPRPPGIHLHNIIGRESADADGDGIVSLASASLGDADSQVVVDADHMNIHRHPVAILEVRRVLLEHLGQMDRWTRGPRRPYDHGIQPALTWRQGAPDPRVRRLPR